MYIAIRTDDGRNIGKISFYCNTLQVSRQAFYDKYKKVLEMIREFDNEYVAIGCRTLKEVEEYKKIINNEFHNRKLFIITGSISI